VYDEGYVKALSTKSLFVTLGTHNIEKTFEVGRQSIEVEKFFIHPDWKLQRFSYDADISVIKLKHSVQFTDYVQPICLWKGEVKPNVQNGVIVGYGFTSNESPKVSATPRELEIPIVSNERCFLEQHQLANISSTRTFCAGPADGRGPCIGDGGGGFYIKYQGKFYLRGIISATLRDEYNRCDLSAYSIYTDIFKFQDWIDQVIAS
jgi:secreted trypsin-like serine protease